MNSSLFPESSKSLVKQYLTRDIYKALKGLSTRTGFTLEKAIRSGVVNADSSIGIYAGDSESYQLFKALFAPIIKHYHGIPACTRHVSDIMPVSLAALDPEGRYILSSRVRAARNVDGYCFTNHIELDQRKKLEQAIVKALMMMSGDMKGTYASFEQGRSEQYSELIRQQLLFPKGDRFQDAAGINRDFPLCRGIFTSHDNRLRVWVNEEDHLRVISQENSSDLTGVYNHFCSAILALEKHLDFARDTTFGYLTSCPTNLGTAMRAGVHIRLEKLSGDRKTLDRITEEYDLQIRGTSGEKTDVIDKVFDISNRQRFGISEVEIIHKLHRGLEKIIQAETDR